MSLWLWCRRGVPGLWTKVGTLCYHTFPVESICSELQFNPVHRVAVVQTDYASVYQIRKYFFSHFVVSGWNSLDDNTVGVRTV